MEKALTDPSPLCRVCGLSDDAHATGHDFTPDELCACGCPQSGHGDAGCQCGCAWAACAGDDPMLRADCEHHRKSEPTYPCVDCGQPRTETEGGKIFTVCDACWDRHYAGVSPTGDRVRAEKKAEFAAASSSRVPRVTPVRELLAALSNLAGAASAVYICDDAFTAQEDNDGRVERDAALGEAIHEAVMAMQAHDQKKARALVSQSDSATPDTDALHPLGRCTCADSGSCAWCVQSHLREERDEARAELAKATTERDALKAQREAAKEEALGAVDACERSNMRIVELLAERDTLRAKAQRLTGALGAATALLKSEFTKGAFVIAALHGFTMNAEQQKAVEEAWALINTALSIAPSAAPGEIS